MVDNYGKGKDKEKEANKLEMEANCEVCKVFWTSITHKSHRTDAYLYFIKYIVPNRP